MRYGGQDFLLFALRHVEAVLGAPVTGRLYTCSSATSGSLRCRAPPHHHTGSSELFYVVSEAAQMLADESVMPADEGDLSGLIRCSDHAGSTPTAPIDRPRLRTSRDFTLPSSEAGQHFSLLALGHLEMIKGEAKLRSDFVEHGG